MDAESVLMLGVFWSWVAGILAVLILGILTPVSVGLLVGGLPLLISRRDYRPVPQFAAVAVLFLVGGVVVLIFAPRQGPALSFWIALSVQFATMAFIIATGFFLKLSIQRVREERAQIDSVRVAPAQVGASVAAAEPGARPRLNAIDAEYYVAEWMRALGAVDSEVTRAKRDGGVDVRSRHYVAQVKHRPQDFVSVDVVRALHGVAATERRTGLVFASGRYSSDALAFARDAGVALFIFRPQEGRLVAANAQAERLRRDGLLGAARMGSASQR